MRQQRIEQRTVSTRPLILVPADRRMVAPHPMHLVGEKYLSAVTDFASCEVLILPVMRERVDTDAILERVDGVMLPGSPSDIEPFWYGENAADYETTRDPDRDHVTLTLIRAAVAKKIPVLGVCRGLQEINVALGGSLHQQVHHTGYNDHRENPELSLDAQYDLAHDVMLEIDGLLHQIYGAEQVRVNSLHGQGVKALAPGLVIEARAEDGLIEAFRGADQSAFILAVQWHPEWKPADHQFYADIFQAFGVACRHYAEQRVLSQR